MKTIHGIGTSFYFALLCSEKFDVSVYWLCCGLSCVHGLVMCFAHEGEAKRKWPEAGKVSGYAIIGQLCMVDLVLVF